MTRIALCFGGPSDERNISAGSLKPWVSWLGGDASVELAVLFFDREERPWLLPEVYYFTNTCEDFEGRLPQDKALDDAGLRAFLAEQDVVVPLIHGAFGEDGRLQALLEEVGVPFVFSSPEALALTFDKAATYGRLAGAGRVVPAHFRFDRARWSAEPRALFEAARELGRPDAPFLCAVKPNRGGSSLGVSLVPDDPEAFEAAVELAFEQDEDVLVEAPLLGREFSVIVLETEAGPVPLAPTEVEVPERLYDTRSKYLHGSGARLTTPLREWSDCAPIRAAARKVWELCGLRDMARLDGFLLADGRVAVTDVNGISGMGFSSFGFLQTALAGLPHSQLIRRLVDRAARRAGKLLPAPRPGAGQGRRVHVLFGGPTSERQVSRQSGIFVGLGLASLGHDVRFVFMDRACRFTEVGLFLALHHDVAEIEELAADGARRAELEEVAAELAGELGAGLLDGARGPRQLQVGPTGDLAAAVAEADFVFLALHGGPGEDGTVQAALEALGKAYNGCGPRASRRGSDKVATVEAVARAGIEGVGVPQQLEVSLEELRDWLDEADWEGRFARLARELGRPKVVAKPACDGCSTGVKLLAKGAELAAFVRAVVEMRSFLPAGALGPGSRPLQLPEPPPARWVFEEALVEEHEPPLPAGDWNARNLRGWWEAKRFVELTCAVCDLPPGGSSAAGLAAATPSLTVARAAELSLEEKFQQGVGTNLELDAFLEPERVASLRERILAVARALGVEGYARLDGFYDRAEDRFYVLEVNTLCALTEATVYYSQLLSSFGASPPQALEWIRLAGEASARRRAAGKTPALPGQPV